jgi:DNA-binding response OmpR family regulator
LARNPGNAISRSDLFAQLNPLETYHFGDRSIDLRISRLRRKLNDTTGNPTRILSIRGNGYMLRVTE